MQSRFRLHCSTWADLTEVLVANTGVDGAMLTVQYTVSHAS